MTGTHDTRGVEGDGPASGSIDEGPARKIDTYLERALAADDASEKDFHVRHARQLLEACREQ